MMIIHILVDTSQVVTQDKYITVTVDIIILYDQQQIYLYLVLQDQILQNIYQNILNYINYIFHEFLFN